MWVNIRIIWWLHDWGVGIFPWLWDDFLLQLVSPWLRSRCTDSTSVTSFGILSRWFGTLSNNCLWIAGIISWWRLLTMFMFGVAVWRLRGTYSQHSVVFSIFLCKRWLCFQTMNSERSATYILLIWLHQHCPVTYFHISFSCWSPVYAVS